MLLFKLIEQSSWLWFWVGIKKYDAVLYIFGCFQNQFKKIFNDFFPLRISQSVFCNYWWFWILHRNHLNTYYILWSKISNLSDLLDFFHNLCKKIIHNFSIAELHIDNSLKIIIFFRLIKPIINFIQMTLLLTLFLMDLHFN